MPGTIPPALKEADINIFKCATRAEQLGPANPIVAYWCEYWVVNQILARQLHSTDPDILAYTTTLMDKLEQTKAKHANEEAIIEDIAGQAYIENFAQTTLDRAQRVIRANKVTAQTANTFDAAATFFNLVNIWGRPDEESQQKIKYAKWNATRIYKAIKEGKDPNESNPKPEALSEEGAVSPAVDSMAQPLGSPPPSRPRPVTVEDEPEQGSLRDAAGVSLPHSPASSVPPSRAHDDLSMPDAPPQPVIPGPPTFNPATPPLQQPGGGSYADPHSAAPTMPSPMSPPQLPSSVPDLPQEWTPTPPPPASGAFSPPPPMAPEDHYRQQSSRPFVPPPSGGPPTFAPSPAATAAIAPPPISPPPSNYMDMTPHPSAPPPHLAPSPGPLAPGPANSFARPPIPPSQQPSHPAYQQAPSPHIPVPRAVQPLATAPPAAVAVATSFVADDVAMAQAQKHAKWAISALNFEDVPTAIRELRKALETLGAT